MKIEYWSNEYQRMATVSAEALISGVEVRQQTNIRDGILNPPTISWPSPGAKSVYLTESFIAALNDACNIARRWDQDTGKHYSEVDMQAT
jgi:hypothetical protein